MSFALFSIPDIGTGKLHSSQGAIVTNMSPTDFYAAQAHQSPGTESGNGKAFWARLGFAILSIDTWGRRPPMS